MRSAARAAAPPVGGGVTTTLVDETQPAATKIAATSAISALGDRLVRAVLELIEAMVDTMLAEELAVRADLGDPALVQDDDAVDVLDRREAVGDDDRRPADHQLPQRVLDEMLGLRVDR